VDDERIGFTVKEVKKQDEYHCKVRVDEDSDSDPEWEKMQISKAINSQHILFANKDAALNATLGMPRTPLAQGMSRIDDRTGRMEKMSAPALQRPQKYDLPGIRERMRKRLEEMKEVSRRHEMDSDRAVDDMVESQGQILKAELEERRCSLVLPDGRPLRTGPSTQKTMPSHVYVYVYVKMNGHLNENANIFMRNQEYEH